MKKSILALLALAAPSQSLLAGDFQNLEAIDREVASFTGVPVGQPGGARSGVDGSMRLRTCSQPLLLDWYGTRNEAVLVRCGDPDGWRIFVPVLTGDFRPAQATVKRRDLVRVEASGRGFAVWRDGEALEPGAVGERIPVRIGGEMRHPRIVTAEVVGEGHVRIALR